MKLTEKFASRKFILSILSVISGMTGMVVSENSIFNLIFNVILIVVPTVVYTIIEGRIDKEYIIEAIEKIKGQVEENL